MHAVDDEAGDSVDPQPVCSQVVGVDALQLGVGGEEAADGQRVHAAGGGDGDQDAVVADVVTISEMGGEQGFNQANQLQVIAGTNTAYPLAKTYKLKTAFGSDMLFSPQKATRQGIMLTHLTRWYDNAEILKMATGINGELLGLSGPRNPYPGKLGVIEEGALADLIVVDGDPIANISLVENPEKNFLIIMKDGKIYKDALPS